MILFLVKAMVRTKIGKYVENFTHFQATDQSYVKKPGVFCGGFGEGATCSRCRINMAK